MITPLKSISTIDSTYTAIVLQAGALTNSGRNYPLHELKEAAEKFNVNAERATIFGEFGRLATNDDSLRTNLQHASHVVEKVNVSDDGDVRVFIRTIATPSGQVLKKLLDLSLDVFLQMSASGRTNEEGVVRDLDFYTFNADPMQNLQAFGFVRLS